MQEKIPPLERGRPAQRASPTGVSLVG